MVIWVYYLSRDKLNHTPLMIFATIEPPPLTLKYVSPCLLPVLCGVWMEAVKPGLPFSSRRFDFNFI